MPGVRRLVSWNMKSAWKKRLVIVAALILALCLTVIVVFDGDVATDAKIQLSRAAYESNVLKMRLLVWAGVDVNAYVPGRGHALSSAAAGGHLDAVEFLLERGADVNAKEKWGCTALTDATYGGHAEIVRLLLSKGADVNAACDGDSALHMALERGHTEIAEMLRQRGAKDCSGYGRNKCE
jgi:ankyrin repeat protein